MVHNMQIRKAITTDIKHIIETVQASYKFSYRGYLPDEYLDDLSVTEDILEKWHNYIQKYECYAAEKQNQIVAFTMLDSNKDAKIFEICILYVRPEYQKQGIGSLLVNYVCNIKKQQAYKKSKLWTMKNGPSIKFYEKKGFIATSEEKPWKFDIPIVKMIKNLMNYKFGVYGDSIAFGYGNNNQSWFDELYLGNEALKLAQNGEKIADVLRKIKQDDNHYDTLFLAVGINNLLSGAPKPNQIDISSLINQYEEVLKVAKTKASNIIVQSVLPIREELFPNQDWLDENKWGFNADVETFNQKLAKLCETHQIKYLDTYTNFSSLDLSKIYIDAVHLNKEGQQELARVYNK